MHDPRGKRLDRPLWEDGVELLLGLVVVLVVGGALGMALWWLLA